MASSGSAHCRTHREKAEPREKNYNITSCLMEKKRPEECAFSVNKEHIFFRPAKLSQFFCDGSIITRGVSRSGALSVLDVLKKKRSEDRTR